MLEYILLSIVLFISTVLYRIPRGGPGRETWNHWFRGFSGFGSTGGALIWAGFTGIFLSLFTTLPIWVGLLMVVYLMVAEAPGWARYWPNNEDGGSKIKLNLRGLPLFNPIMGNVYFFLYKIKDRLPTYKSFVDGWTAYGELISGFITAVGTLVVFKVIEALL
jgi:hypothetical protein